ncbi:MAG: hypothetical protein AAF337_00315 [Pseudomonadota bacterium]
MPNVQLYDQVADAVSPALRQIVPDTQADDALSADDEFAAEALESGPLDAALATPAQGPLLEHRLRITGTRPMTFTGRHVAMATGWNNTVPRWYEINLYESESGDIVCDVRLFGKSPDHHDLYRVGTEADWSSAVRWLESYNPAHDLSCDIAVDDESLSAAEIALQGISLRQEVFELRNQYDSLVGDLLYQLKQH